MEKVRATWVSVSVLVTSIILGRRSHPRQERPAIPAPAVQL